MVFGVVVIMEFLDKNKLIEEINILVREVSPFKFEWMDKFSEIELKYLKAIFSKIFIFQKILEKVFLGKESQFQQFMDDVIKEYKINVEDIIIEASNKRIY